MLVSGYDELRKSLDRGFDVLIIIKVSDDRINAQLSTYRLGDKFDRRNP